MSPEKLRERYAKEDEQEIDAAINALLQHKHGRKLLWWLLEVSGVGAQPFTQNALTTSFNCGQLNIGNQVLSRITSVSPEGYVQMMKEKADERTKRDESIVGAYARSEPDYREHPDPDSVTEPDT
jgi:hypothetical protein